MIYLMNINVFKTNILAKLSLLQIVDSNYVYNFLILQPICDPGTEFQRKKNSGKRRFFLKSEKNRNKNSAKTKRKLKIKKRNGKVIKNRKKIKKKKIKKNNKHKNKNKKTIFCLFKNKIK